MQALGAEAGEKVEASVAELPAATARKMPASTMASAASLTAWQKPPPRDMFTTAPLGQSRLGASVTTNSIPAMTPALVPEPSSPSTLTARRVVDLATP